jgi:hypothetical protein
MRWESGILARAKTSGKDERREGRPHYVSATVPSSTCCHRGRMCISNFALIDAVTEGIKPPNPPMMRELASRERVWNGVCEFLIAFNETLSLVSLQPPTAR